ncbi:MAG: hypothetical protein ACREQ9_25880, partial [Candidatus Binatia bacterium]
MARGWLRLTRFSAYFFLAATFACLAYYLARPDDLPLWLAAIAVIEFGGFAYLGLRMTHRPDRYSIEVLDAGLRGGASPVVLPWTMIAGLRSFSSPSLTTVEVL